MKSDLETLRRFNRKVARLEESGFAKRYADEVPNVIAKLEKPVFRDEGDGRFEIYGQVRSYLEDFSQDEIDAFVLTHRILTQKNDPLSIASLTKIYARPWMHEEARAPFNDARAQLNEYLDGPATVGFEEGHMAIGELADITIYGGLAHSNEQKTAIFESWIGSGMAGFFWAEFFAYAREMLRYFRYFRDLNEAVIRTSGRTRQVQGTRLWSRLPSMRARKPNEPKESLNINGASFEGLRFSARRHTVEERLTELSPRRRRLPPARGGRARRRSRRSAGTENRRGRHGRRGCGRPCPPGGAPRRPPARR
jgi:hypothetical protein